MNDFIITCPELEAELKKNPREITLLDVRSSEEHADCHIEGDVLIPLDELLGRAPRELDLNANLVIYCAHGIRSMNATMGLKRLGFDRVRSLQGGIAEWQEQRSVSSR